MDKYKSIEILWDNLSNSVQKLGLNVVFRFQQDNDPKHTALQTRKWLLCSAPRILLPSPQSLDLNPIEHLRDHFERSDDLAGYGITPSLVTRLSGNKCPRHCMIFMAVRSAVVVQCEHVDLWEIAGTALQLQAGAGEHPLAVLNELVLCGPEQPKWTSNRNSPGFAVSRHLLIDRLSKCHTPRCSWFEVGSPKSSFTGSSFRLASSYNVDVLLLLTDKAQHCSNLDFRQTFTAARDTMLAGGSCDNRELASSPLFPSHSSISPTLDTRTSQCAPEQRSSGNRNSLKTRGNARISSKSSVPRQAIDASTSNSRRIAMRRGAKRSCEQPKRATKNGYDYKLEHGIRSQDRYQKPLGCRTSAKRASFVTLFRRAQIMVDREQVRRTHTTPARPHPVRSSSCLSVAATVNRDLTCKYDPAVIEPCPYLCPLVDVALELLMYYGGAVDNSVVGGRYRPIDARSLHYSIFSLAARSAPPASEFLSPCAAELAVPSYALHSPADRQNTLHLTFISFHSYCNGRSERRALRTVVYARYFSLICLANCADLSSPATSAACRSARSDALTAAPCLSARVFVLRAAGGSPASVPITLDSLTEDRDGLHFDPPNMAVRNPDPRSEKNKTMIIRSRIGVVLVQSGISRTQRGKQPRSERFCRVWHRLFTVTVLWISRESSGHVSDSWAQVINMGSSLEHCPAILNKLELCFPPWLPAPWCSSRTTRLPPRRTEFDSRRGCVRIFACGNRAGRCRCSMNFLGDPLFPPPLHSGIVPYSPRSTITGFQDLDVKNCPNFSTSVHIGCQASKQLANIWHTPDTIACPEVAPLTSYTQPITGSEPEDNVPTYFSSKSDGIAQNQHKHSSHSIASAQGYAPHHNTDRVGIEPAIPYRTTLFHITQMVNASPGILSPPGTLRVPALLSFAHSFTLSTYDTAHPMPLSPSPSPPILRDYPHQQPTVYITTAPQHHFSIPTGAQIFQVLSAHTSTNAPNRTMSATHILYPKIQSRRYARPSSHH
ncbi:hypothetical protein PR048_001636 [Dryococelus australis]|uniref:Uncharacterized protein n=1 Tax=Dryococelus australis TaxID=614101 RepID=A0ABQ9II04_9NEOP|nr:hypothetical protein PR048_001636 [Dryococelus australis]